MQEYDEMHTKETKRLKNLEMSETPKIKLRKKVPAELCHY